MNKIFTCVKLFALFFVLPNLTFAQVAGDYRSNVTTGGDWNVPSNWETFNGTTWVTASSYPNSTNGTITILAGDSIHLLTPETIDQVVIQNGGALSIFNTTVSTTVTLNDGAGTDIDNSGTLYVSTNGILLGSASSASVISNSGSNIVIRNSGRLSGVTASTASGGEFNLVGPGVLENSTYTNNGVLFIGPGTPNIAGSTITNNALAVAPGSSNIFLAGTAGILVNAASGTLRKDNASGIFTVNAPVSFTNNGTVTGPGQITFSSTTLTNTGSIQPGIAIDILTVNPSFVTGKTPSVTIEIGSSGAVAGTNYDQLAFSNTGAVNLSGTTLNLVDQGSLLDPIGTVYTIMSTAAGSFTGTFLAVNKPTNYTIQVNATTVTATKIATFPLPVVWGTFTAIAKNSNETVLSWSTEQEVNTSHFEIEYSTDGRKFNIIGTQKAAGNSELHRNYTFTHRNAQLRDVNYYRLKQVDIDGKILYSPVRTIRLSNGKVKAVQLIQNPVTSKLKLDVQTDGILIVINDLKGNLIKSIKLNSGIQEVDVQQFASGMYQLSIFQNGDRVDALRFVKTN